MSLPKMAHSGQYDDPFTTINIDAGNPLFPIVLSIHEDRYRIAGRSAVSISTRLMDAVAVYLTLLDYDTAPLRRIIATLRDEWYALLDEIGNEGERECGGRKVFEAIASEFVDFIERPVDPPHPT